MDDCKQASKDNMHVKMGEDCKMRAPVCIKYVGPDAPVITTDNGGKHSASPYRPDLLPPVAVLAVSAVLKTGAEKYGVDNWRHVSRSEHLGHALTHIFARLSGDQQDDHLAHAACRLLFALETR